jgi:hypothetical protein
MVSERNRDYSLESFKKLAPTVQKKYFELARERNPEFVSSESIIEVIAANIWMEEMTHQEGG